MSILSILYGLLIMPLQLIFEEIYFFAYKYCENPGLSIIALSFIVNLLVLPLYDRADAMQIAERDIEVKLRKGVEHIKKTFRGDEQLMMLQTYYRQNNYSPTDIIKGSISLFLEIPFFVAAYQFLSHLEILKGVSLGPIKDLGAPDALLTVFGLTINIMPILMTAINIVSAYIFTKDFPLKTKIQLQGMAVFFLVFLYNSPAGLVFYWTLNNLFNLVKTVVYKLNDPQKGAQLALSFCGLLIIIYSLFFLENPTTKKRLFGIICSLILNGSFIIGLAKKKITREFSFIKIDNGHNNSKLFFSCGLFLALLIGAVIPSAVISASPQEFVIIQYFQQPIWYIVYAFAVAVGFFIIWFGVFYWLAPINYKIKFEFMVWAICGISIVDYMFFGKNLGVLTNTLQYENGLFFSLKQKVFNIIIILVILTILYVIWRKIRAYITEIVSVLIIALVCMVGLNIIDIQKNIAKSSGFRIADTNEKIFCLSKNGKNVVIIMLDRAVGYFIPYFFNEKPFLKEQYRGFTYYPNMVSYAPCTNIGTPGLFGGYEYIPEEMNKRNEEPLSKKHNEALSVMPALFSSNNYDVTLCDLPYANYQWIPDMSIFKDFPNTKTYITSGMYGSTLNMSKYKDTLDIISSNQRNFYCFSLVKCMPLFLQKYWYDNGNYNSLNSMNSNQKITSLATALGTRKSFLEKYNVLAKLPDMTSFKEEGNTASIFVNETTHESCMLKLPEYIPARRVDNRVYEKEHSNRFVLNGESLLMNNTNRVVHYQTNMAAILQLGKWFDFLRKNQVYDNTKIIIVSDHGWKNGYDKNKISDTKFDASWFYALLMVKDFHSNEFKISNELMTNADVPGLAFKDLIDKPINPFTGKLIESNKKKERIYLFGSHKWDIRKNNGTVFQADSWYSVETDVHDMKNWKLVKENALLPY